MDIISNKNAIEDSLLFADIHKEMSIKTVSYNALLIKLKVLRKLTAHVDGINKIISNSFHSVLLSYWYVIVENADCSEESLDCLLKVCQTDPSIKEDLILRNGHVFCLQIMKRYLRRQNLRLMAAELLSLMLLKLYGKEVLLLSKVALDSLRKSVIQDILINGGVTLISRYLDEFSASKNCSMFENLLNSKLIL